jgi:hypothetical protein
MSAASDRVQLALASLDEKAKAHMSARSSASAAFSAFTDAQVEVDAAIEAVKVEKATIVDGAK